MHILIAPNAFKNSLSATAAAEAIRDGLMASRLSCTCECFPIGDGGDGTGELIIKKSAGWMVEEEAHDPLGREINAAYGLVDEGKTAVIEMAAASGLRLLAANELNPLASTSYGTGELIMSALKNGVQQIILCLGGSATVDCGCGIIKALGGRFLDAGGRELSAAPESLLQLATIDTSAVDKRVFNCEIIAVCDVVNPLLGTNGAAAVFGPQKGASADDVKKLEQALQTFSFVVQQQAGKNIAHVKHGGAAGGTAAGLFAFLNAKLAGGIDYFLSITGFNSSLHKADLLITGEGSIDEQTLQGKGPAGVSQRAKRKGMPVVGLAGKIPLQTSKDLQQLFDVLLPINHDCVGREEALKATKENLKRTAMELGNLLAFRAARRKS